MIKLPRSLVAPVAIAAMIVIADQFVKWFVVRKIGPGSDRHSMWLAGDWLGLSYAENTGVAFGLLRGHSSVVLVASSIGVLMLIGWYVYAHRHSLPILVAGGLIAGGAIGNTLDRIRLSYVRDFFAVGPWPSFNLADSAITIGVLFALFGSKREEQSSAGEHSASLAANTDRRRALLDTIE